MAGTIHGVSQDAITSTGGLNGVRPRWPEQLQGGCIPADCGSFVSMESGLDGRNNAGRAIGYFDKLYVSMESGLDGRNNEH